jgi:hypothetical protein
MIALVFAAALMAAAPPAGETVAQQTAAKPTKATKNDLVCKKESVVGSRMKSRVCLTQAEWDQRAIDAKDQVDAAQRNRPLQSN